MGKILERRYGKYKLKWSFYIYIHIFMYKKSEKLKSIVEGLARDVRDI